MDAKAEELRLKQRYIKFLRKNRIYSHYMYEYNRKYQQSNNPVALKRRNYLMNLSKATVQEHDYIWSLIRDRVGKDKRKFYDYNCISLYYFFHSKWHSIRVKYGKVQ